MIPTSTLAVKPKIFPSTAEALGDAVPAATIGFHGAGAELVAAGVGSGAAVLAGAEIFAGATGSGGMLGSDAGGAGVTVGS